MLRRSAYTEAKSFSPGWRDFCFLAVLLGLCFIGTPQTVSVPAGGIFVFWLPQLAVYSTNTTAVAQMSRFCDPLWADLRPVCHRHDTNRPGHPFGDHLADPQNRGRLSPNGRLPPMKRSIFQAQTATCGGCRSTVGDHRKKAATPGGWSPGGGWHALDSVHGRVSPQSAPAAARRARRFRRWSQSCPGSSRTACKSARCRCAAG